MATELIVLDLEGSRAARPVLEWAARRAARRAGAGSRILLHGPDDGAYDFALPVLRPRDVLTPAAVAENQRWVGEVSRELVEERGRALFPSTAGIHLGDLSRLEAQIHFADFALLAGAMLRALRDAPAACCRVFSADPGRAAALRDAARALAPRATAWSPPLVDAVRRGARRLSLLRRGGRAPSSTDAAPEPDPGRAPVLVLSESGPMAQMFARVEAQLRPQERWVRVQFGGAAELREEGAATLLSLGRPCVVPARRVGRFRRAWRRAAPRVRELDLRARMHGVAVRAPLFALVEHLYGEIFDQQAEHLELANTLLDRVRPELLVVGNDRWWVGLGFVLAARARGIPTLCVQDGITADIAGWRWLAADRLAASGVDWPRLLVRHGVAAERITITGQPRYDALCAVRDRLGGADVRGALALDPAARYVLFASQPHQTGEYVRQVLDAILQVPEANVLLRPHPSEAPGKYDAWLGAGRVSLRPADDIFALVRAADVVVTEYSTVALEAAILGVPVVTATFGGRPSPVPYAELGLAIPAAGPAELTAAVRAVVAGRAAAVPGDLLEELVGPLDGQSARRVTEAVRAALAAARGRELVCNA